MEKILPSPPIPWAPSYFPSWNGTRIREISTRVARAQLLQRDPQIKGYCNFLDLRDAEERTRGKG